MGTPQYRLVKLVEPCIPIQIIMTSFTKFIKKAYCHSVSISSAYLFPLFLKKKKQKQKQKISLQETTDLACDGVYTISDSYEGLFDEMHFKGYLVLQCLESFSINLRCKSKFSMW